MRTRELFNDEWLFHEGDINLPLPANKGPLYKQAKTERMLWGPACRAYKERPDAFDYEMYPTDNWEFVRLPHDYIVNKTPDEKQNDTLGYFEYTNGWYRKHFDLGKEDFDKRITLEFGGIATESIIYLNGTELKRNISGYNSFEVDITDFVKFDEDNVLAVYVKAENHEGWWYEGAGIYRDVYLVKTEKIAVDMYGVYVNPEKISDKLWNVNVETTVVSIKDADENVTVVTEIIDKNGTVVAKGQVDMVAETYNKRTVCYNLGVENPVLWDVDNPYLYNIKTSVVSGGKVVDEYYTKTGFRYFECDAQKGFFLNGRQLKIKGVCAHEDCGLLGKAVPKNIHKYKMGLIKEMGANGYRTSHYQQNEAILDACDELGVIVLNEARWFSSSEDCTKQLEALVKRDRNRPSVFFWSLSNEEPCGLNENGRRITKNLMRVVKRLDKVRPVTSAICHSPDKATVCDELDIIGVNYNFHLYDEIRKNFPEIPVFSSENCATGTTRGWYYKDSTDKGFLSAFDKSSKSDLEANQYRSREVTWKNIAKHEYIMGGYQWTAFEHRGETVWPRLCSQSGAIDLFLNKKDAFYQNQSHWKDEPMIHMLPHWNIEKEQGEDVSVWAYTNCDQAELVLNGKSYGKQDVEKFTHLEWVVPYEAGKIEVIGYNNGIECARDVNETTSSPEKIVLKLENKIKKPNDIGIVTCYAVDSKGRFVTDAEIEVEFFAESGGRIISTGSDVSDHTPLNSRIRKMRAGLITVAVGVELFKGKAVMEQGTITIYAKSKGIKSAKLDITIG